MKRKFSPLPEYQENPHPVAIPGEYPVKWLNPHGMVVIERCYSAATQQWTIAHRQNVVVIPAPASRPNLSLNGR